MVFWARLVRSRDVEEVVRSSLGRADQGRLAKFWLLVEGSRRLFIRASRGQGLFGRVTLSSHGGINVGWTSSLYLRARPKVV